MGHLSGYSRLTTLTLRGGIRRLRRGGLRLLVTVLVSQLAIFALVLPVNHWLFREALRSVGMTGLDLGAGVKPAGLPLTLGLIALIMFIAFIAIAVQFVLFVVLLSGHADGGEVCRQGEQVSMSAHLRAVLRKLLRPSALPLFGYLFILIPLSGFGFTSLLAKGIAIPPFISGELAKTVPSWVVLSVVLILLGIWNLRLALTVPIFVLTNATGGRATRLSVRLTRGYRVWLALCTAASIVIVVAALATVALFVLALLPTLVADTIAPDAAPAVAAISLGVAQLLALVLTGGTTAALAAMFTQHFMLMRARLPEDVVGIAPMVREMPARHRWALPTAVVTLAAFAAGSFSVAGWDTLHRLHEAPDTLVLAHRGFSARGVPDMDGGVENTIGGLEAAAAVGADLVEMDVMETADHQFVVMHDANLSRLAGLDRKVADLTLAELTQITVRDLAGNEGRIPSLDEYLLRADELGMPLLVEIKLGGNDTPDHVERLVAQMEELGVLDNHIFHSLDLASVNTLKTLRPDLTVGYTMAFAAVEAPETIADMIVVEEWTASEAVQHSAERAGLAFFTWTVNDLAGIRDHLRRGTDGIITDHPDEVLRLRGEMRERPGMAAVLFDALSRFTTLS